MSKRESEATLQGKCKKLWEDARNPLDAFERVSQAFRNCECENCSASVHSHGTVRAREILIRILFSPAHFNGVTRQVALHAFADAYKRGLSVNRRNHTTRAALLRQASKSISRSHNPGTGIPKTGYAFAVATYEDIQNLMLDDESRMFCVYDTAGKSNRAHADVVYSRFRTRKLPRSMRYKLNKALSDLFSFTELSDIF